VSERATGPRCSRPRWTTTSGFSKEANESFIKKAVGNDIGFIRNMRRPRGRTSASARALSRRPRGRTNFSQSFIKDAGGKDGNFSQSFIKEAEEKDGNFSQSFIKETVTKDSKIAGF
jgi:hypothetical protein